MARVTPVVQPLNSKVTQWVAEAYSFFPTDGASEEEINLSKTVMKFWANFARNGWGWWQRLDGSGCDVIFVGRESFLVFEWSTSSPCVHSTLKKTARVIRFVAVRGLLRLFSSKEGAYILAHGFRGFNCWSFDLLVLVVSLETGGIMWWLNPFLSLSHWWSGKRERKN